MAALGNAAMAIGRHAQPKAPHRHGMAAGQEWQLELNSRQKQAMPEVWLGRWISAEQADRQARSLNYQLHAAKFTHHRDWAGLDRTETPLDKARIEQLATARFMGQAHILILVGGTDTGKTHLAAALAVAAIHLGKRICFYNAVDMVNHLGKGQQPGKTGSLGKRLSQADAAIVDGLGYLPFPQSGGALPFHLISQLDEKASLTVTTNLNFAEWVHVFGDEKMTAALLDRIIHHCGTLETGNDSYRLQRKKTIENG